MSKLGNLKIDKQTGWFHCKHKLGSAVVDVNIDATEESIELVKLTSVAQKIIDGWQARHKRLVKVVSDELVSQGYLDENNDLAATNCVPFYIRIYADPDGEISYNVGYNVPSVLESDDEYVDVEEEIKGEWLNVEVCSTE